MNIYAERVRAGAGLLDGVKPGWEKEIDLKTLDLAVENCCILGQTYGLYGYGLNTLFPHRNDFPDMGAITKALGFNIPEHDFCRSSFRKLTQAWRTFIRARLREASR